MSRKLVLVLVFVVVVLVGVLPAMAQTPIPDALTTAEVLTGSQELITTFGLMAIILLGAILGFAIRMVRGFKRAAS